MILPSSIDPVYFDETYRLQPELWLEAIAETCACHGLPAKGLRAFTDGSNLIAAVEERWVVKIFPPHHRHQWESEYRVLQALNGRLSFPIPALIAFGEREEGWTYVILDLLPGVSLEQVWEQLPTSERYSLLERIGNMMAEVHAIPVPAALASLEPHWPDFLNAQIEGCMMRHRHNGMPDWFMAGLENYVNQSLALLPSGENAVILTGEYTPFNLLADKVDGAWAISGMIDFGDAMIGSREYDWLGPGLFLCAGKPDLLKALFSGYGLASRQLDESLRRRLMLLTILHRYSNLNFQLRIPDWQNRVNSLEALEQLVWPFGRDVTPV